MFKLFDIFKRKRPAQPIPFETQFLTPDFFGEAEPGHVGISQDGGARSFRGITFNTADGFRICRELNATPESLTLFPLVCLPVEDEAGKYLLIMKNVDPMHHQYQFHEFEPGPEGATVLQLDDTNIAKLEALDFRFARPLEGWRERLDGSR